MPPGGIRTHNLTRWAAVDLRLRTRDRWDRQYETLHTHNFEALEGKLREDQLKKLKRCLRRQHSTFRVATETAVAYEICIRNIRSEIKTTKVCEILRSEGSTNTTTAS